MAISNPLFDKLFNAPELLRPGVKPRFGTVKQGLGANLSGWWLFNEEAGAAALDISGKYTSGVLTSSAAFGYGDKGRLITFNGTAGNKVALERPVDLPDSECTIIFKIKINSADNSGIFGDKYVGNWASTNGLNLSIRFDGGILFKVGVNEAFTTTDYFNDFDYHTGIVRYKDGEALEIYIDKSEISYDAQATAAAYVTGLSGNARIGTYYDEAANRSTDGKLDYLIVLDHKISLTQAFAIVDNPYGDLDAIQSVAIPIAAPSTGVEIFRRRIEGY